MDNQIQELSVDLSKTIGNLKDELSGVRANRPSPKLVEDIKVDYYGQLLPLKQLGSVSVVPPRGLQITLWDGNAVQPAAKAIESSNVGVTPNIQGNTIHLNLPTLTAERRQELVKLVKSISENHRIRVRSLRDDYNKKIKAAADAKTISDDQKFKFLEQIQNKINQTNKDIETLLDNKINEIQE